MERPEPIPARPSPSDRYLARRRTTFIRDWILVLVALGLAIAAGAFRGDRIKSNEAPAAAYAATAP